MIKVFCDQCGSEMEEGYGDKNELRLVVEGSWQEWEQMKAIIHLCHLCVKKNSGLKLLRQIIEDRGLDY